MESEKKDIGYKPPETLLNRRLYPPHRYQSTEPELRLLWGRRRFCDRKRSSYDQAQASFQIHGFRKKKGISYQPPGRACVKLCELCDQFMEISPLSQKCVLILEKQTVLPTSMIEVRYKYSKCRKRGHIKRNCISRQLRLFRRSRNFCRRVWLMTQKPSDARVRVTKRKTVPNRNDRVGFQVFRCKILGHKAKDCHQSERSRVISAFQMQESGSQSQGL